MDNVEAWKSTAQRALRIARQRGFTGQRVKLVAAGAGLVTAAALFAPYHPLVGGFGVGHCPWTERVHHARTEGRFGPLGPRFHEHTDAARRSEAGVRRAQEEVRRAQEELRRAQQEAERAQQRALEAAQAARAGTQPPPAPGTPPNPPVASAATASGNG